MPSKTYGELLEDLNTEQREAFETLERCVVLAGPGSGKTDTLVLKVAKLLGEVIKPPQGLACVTYSNEAAKEFRIRLDSLGFALRPRVFLGTVHSFCLTQIIQPFGPLFLSEFSFPVNVAGNQERSQCMQIALDKEGINDPPERWINNVGKYRRENLDIHPTDFQGDERVVEVTRVYRNEVQRQGLLDFDDMILLALRLVQEQPFVRKALESRFPWLVIDEYQDLGRPLHSIVTQLLDKGEFGLFAVGDPDQSIYGFTGANPDYLQQISKRSDVHKVSLRLNYRCAQRIIEGSLHILDPEAPRPYQVADTRKQQGEIYFQECSEGLQEQADYITRNIILWLEEQGIRKGEIAILIRFRDDGNAIKESLESEGIRYWGVADGRYDRTPITSWIEDCARWCSGGWKQAKPSFHSIARLWTEFRKEAGLEVEVEGDRVLLERNKLFMDLLPLQAPNENFSSWLSSFIQALDLELLLKLRASRFRDKQRDVDALTQLQRSCEQNGSLSEVTVAEFAGIDIYCERIVLSTIHGSKGLQWDVVIMPGLEQGRLPSWLARSAEALREERRLFYVGITMARKFVFLLWSGFYVQKGRVWENGRSVYIDELIERIERSA